MSRLKLPDSLVDGAGPRNVIEREIVMQRFQINLTLRKGLPNRFDLRSEEETSPVPGIEERFDAESIPCQQEPLPLFVPNGEGKHPVE
jgi:hypothetical protein